MDAAMPQVDVRSLLVSNRYFPPQRGGISHFMGSVAIALGRDRVCCLTNAELGAEEGEVERQGVAVYRSPRAFSDQTITQALGLGLSYAQILFREHPQVVQLAMAYEGHIGLFGRRILGLPFVIYAHGNEVLDAIDSQWDKPKIALQQAARVFANSRFTADLVRQAGVDPRRVEIIHPGCNTEQFQPHQPSREFRERLLGRHWKNRILLTVGLESMKGHDMVIKALPKLLQTFPDVTYLIVGGGSQERLASLASECGVRGNVVFAGLVRQIDLPSVYSICDIFVMPSRQNLAKHSVEGFGMAYLEASASAKPVVGGRAGGVPDAVMDGITGLLVDPLDCEDIGQALGRLLSKPDYAQLLGEQGRSRTVNEFRWELVGKRIQSLLNRVVQEDRKPGALC